MRTVTLLLAALLLAGVIPMPVAPLQAQGARRTPTPVALQATLLGAVSYQGLGPAGDPRWAQPLRVTFSPPGTSRVVAAAWTASDPHGQFLATAPPGTYDVDVKHSQTLSRRAARVSFTLGNTTSVSFGQLRTGDLNDDNRVSETMDYPIMQPVSGTSCTSPTWDPRADLDQNCVVNAIDYSLMRSNFGLSGPLPGGG